ncbi:hypothetical protein SSABA_v1c04490 [Spiroplasma sabaudiense Ar-1343]|uniref:Lipoprotein n=1 Tax=Spiroplasma sabaudiense Ar-1343 TaxID=1276257 RepID=W6AA31_9MOLU|nr:hypothetical protein [Spiroplasma sabaudiense]AHI53856.1 hypothetical protein SSABA_v1c04490 [Spiroplasma sabaudiense Ar-1343]
MKKLLSILSASIIVTSAPLSVVACKKPVIDENHVDNSKLLKEFIDLLDSLFREHMQNQFSEFQFLNAIEAKEKFEGFDINKLWDLLQTNLEGNKEYILDQGSNEFLNFVDFFTQVINLKTLQSKLDQKILEKPEYKVFLINNANPFQDFINLEEVILVDKSNLDNQRIVSIELKVSTEINYLNSTQTPAKQKFYYSPSITILEDVDISEDVKTIAQDLTDKITSSETANKFNFVSNSANTFKTASEINNLTNFEEIFKKEIASEVLESPLFTFNLNDVNYENPDKYTILADIPAPVDHVFKWSQDEQKANLIKAALKNGGQDLEDLAIFHSKRDSIFNGNSLYPELIQYLKEDSQSSEVINQYHLWEHFKRGNKTSAFRNIVSSLGIELDKGHETQEQRRTIGLFGTQITGIKLVYQPEIGPEIIFEMPEQFIVNRQLTSFSTTQELHNEFTRANFLFMREAYGFNQKDVSVSEDLFDYTFEFEQPEISSKKITPGEYYNTREVFNQIFDKTVTKLESQKDSYNISSFKDFINGYSFINNSEKFKINDEGYIFFYTSSNVLLSSVQLSQSYGTSDLQWGFQGSIAINVSAGVRDDIITSEFGNQKTPWKFK